MHRLPFQPLPGDSTSSPGRGPSRRSIICVLFSIVLSWTVDATAQSAAGDFDLVLSGGRVMDPESGLDQVRDIGIVSGRIAALSTQPLRGKRVIDVSGLVVAPGFIDLHAHGMDVKSAQLQAQDGVTTALESELGTLSVERWYAAREGKAPINFGVAVGHRQARARALSAVDVPDPLFSADIATLERHREWALDPANDTQIRQMLADLDKGLDEGALGIGTIIQHTHGARREEILALFRLAARRSVTVFAHVRSMGGVEPDSALAAVQEVIADAAATGASLHIMHVPSSCLRETPLCLELIAGARQRGLDITTESYAYTAASTAITAATFDAGWQQRLGISYPDLQWVATGERLSESSFETFRRQGGQVIMHMIPEPVVDLAIASPLVLIASDGLPFTTGGEHPRGAGNFARVLGHYVREKQALSLMDALAKMSWLPARRLEKEVPAMARKGRIKPGADADLTVFDADRVRDRASFEKPMQPSAGIVHVLVSGVPVLSNSELLQDARPGQAVRRSVPASAK
jgi:N-acyl-D-aspartate/D-glutamate deacylase